jgi:hypothetical protein
MSVRRVGAAAIVATPLTTAAIAVAPSRCAPGARAERPHTRRTSGLLTVMAIFDTEGLSQRKDAMSKVALLNPFTKKDD